MNLEAMMRRVQEPTPVGPDTNVKPELAYDCRCCGAVAGECCTEVNEHGFVSRYGYRDVPCETRRIGFLAPVSGQRDGVETTDRAV